MPAPTIFEWIYNSRSGAVNQLPWAIAEGQLHSGLGWHGPFNSKQEALDYYKANAPANPGWHAPAGTSQILSEIPGTVGTAAKDATGAVVDTVKKDFLGGLDLNQLFLRIGEALLGIVLIAVGIAKLTGTANVVSKLVKAAI